MTILSYIFSALVLLQMLIIVAFVTFRITCFFRKSCKWKKCPFRKKGTATDMVGFVDSYCSKCPYPFDEEEEQQMHEEIEHLHARIDSYKRKHATTPQSRE